MTDSMLSSLSQFGAVFTVQAGQRIPCAPSTSWGSSPSELEYRSGRFPLTRSTFVDSNGWPYHEAITFEVEPSIDESFFKPWAVNLG